MTPRRFVMKKTVIVTHGIERHVKKDVRNQWHCPFVSDIFTVSASTFFGRTIRVVSIIPRLVGYFCAGQGAPVDADISDSAVEEVILPESDSRWRLVRQIEVLRVKFI